MDIAGTNKRLLEDIVQLCRLEDREKPEVILLIGKIGAGKSAFINTVYKVFTGRYHEIARQGAGSAQSVTVELQRYDHLGLSLKHVADKERRKLLSGILDKLPRILDFVGLANVDTEELAELLELVVGGFIPEGTCIMEMEKLQKKKGVGSLKIVFNTPDPDQVVTKLVFVQSCTDPIPENLIACLKKVLTTTDPATMARKYNPDVFLLFTKYDLVQNPSEQLHITQREIPVAQISLKDFEKNEKDIASDFNFIGALKTNRIRWTSFTDAVEEDNPHINNIVLKFIQRMIEPSARKNRSGRKVIGILKNAKLWCLGFQNRLHCECHVSVTPARGLLFVLLIAILAVFYKLLSAKV